MVARNWTGATAHIEWRLAIVGALKIPTSAWRVHATCADFYRQLKNDDAVETHRKHAEAVISSLANSFAPDGPLRRSFLAAPEVRRISRAGGRHRRAVGRSNPLLASPICVKTGTSRSATGGAPTGGR